MGRGMARSIKRGSRDSPDHGRQRQESCRDSEKGHGVGKTCVRGRGACAGKQASSPRNEGRTHRGLKKRSYLAMR